MIKTLKKIEIVGFFLNMIHFLYLRIKAIVFLMGKH